MKNIKKLTALFVPVVAFAELLAYALELLHVDNVAEIVQGVILVALLLDAVGVLHAVTVKPLRLARVKYWKVRKYVKRTFKRSKDPPR
jgi:hypothetical protein